jgi:hypothetical protein
MTERIANCDLELERIIRDMRKDYAEHRYLMIDWETGKQRTKKQNSALHVFCELLSDLLNASGLDQRKVLKPSIEIPWTGKAVKEFLWKPIQEVVIHKQSTTEADRTEYTKVHGILAHHLATKLGLICPEWPSKQTNDAASPQRRRA